MKAKDYKSITEILEKKYKKKFYLFMDLQDCMNRIIMTFLEVFIIFEVVMLTMYLIKQRKEQ
jgi:hypothetical protein